MTAFRIVRRGPVLRFTDQDGSVTRPGSGPRAAVRFSKLGLRGLRGAAGDDGAPGAPGQDAAVEDPGDLTLIFDNHLI